MINNISDHLIQTNFTIYDSIIVIVYLISTLIIGLYAKNKINVIDDFIVAGRSIGTGLGIASMAGTEMGLITIMYSAQKGFVGGFAAFHIEKIGGYHPAKLSSYDNYLSKVDFLEFFSLY